MPATVGSEKPPKKWKKRTLAFAVVTALSYVLVALLISTSLDRRAPVSAIPPGGYNPLKVTPSKGDTFSIVSWNVMQARGSRGAYNGSESRLPVSGLEEDQTQKGILQAIDELSHSHDLILLQEIGGKEDDPASQASGLKHSFPELRYMPNHLNAWLPWPFSRERSMATGMAYVQGDGDNEIFASMGSSSLQMGASWPASLWKEASYFSLVEFRQPAGLVIIQLSLMPIRDTTNLREAFSVVRETAMKEYESGKHVIIGGDWGMVPPNFRQEMVSIGGQVPEGLQAMPLDLMPLEWLLFFDPMRPSMRSLAVPYSEHGSPKTTTDFFICSPNVRVLGIEVLDQQFEFSSHQPVSMQLILE